MSNEELIKMNCHHSGQFKETNGVTDYIDGVLDVVEVHPDASFTHVISMKLLDKSVDLGRMWYKLPFEDLAYKHPLWKNVDANTKKMQSAGHWMRELDVYVEKSVHYELIGNVEAIPDENPSDGEGNLEYEPEGETDDEANDDEVGLFENAESDEEDEVGEADIEVFNHNSYEEQIPDEDEVYPATDDSSSDEEEQAERLVKKNLPDGVFSLRQVFSSGQDFKANVIRYVPKTRRNVVFDRWEKIALGAKCKGKGCGWHIYCAIENPIQKWMVKTYYDEHQCHPVGRFADLFLEDLKRDPEMSDFFFKEG